MSGNFGIRHSKCFGGKFTFFSGQETGATNQAVNHDVKKIKKEKRMLWYEMMIEFVMSTVKTYFKILKPKLKSRVLPLLTVVVLTLFTPFTLFTLFTLFTTFI